MKSFTPDLDSPGFQPKWVGYTCQRCHKQETTLRESQVPSLCPACSQSWASFRNQTPERYRTARLDDLPKRLVERFKGLPSDRGFYVWGKPGTGKTHALYAFCRDCWCRQEVPVQVVAWDDLCLDLRNTFRRGSRETEKAILMPLIGRRVLMLDDVGVTVSGRKHESDFSRRTFMYILDQRLAACRPTFVTSNKSMEDLGASFDERILSRLIQACDVVKVVGPDRRRMNCDKGGQKENEQGTENQLSYEDNEGR